MDDLWYYVEGEENRGPVAEADLRRLAADGRLGDDTLVWRNGMSDWAPFRAAFPPQPVAAPATKACPMCGEQILAVAKKCKHCGETLDPALRATEASQQAGGPPPLPPHYMVATWNPGIAAVLSFFWPGLGQIYKGEVLAGFLWMIAVPIGYLCLIIPGVILHIVCIVKAASTTPPTR